MSKSRNLKPLTIFCGCRALFVSDLIGNSDHRFSHAAAHSSFRGVSHYANVPMQYSEIFKSCKTYTFSLTKCYIFLAFAQT